MAAARKQDWRMAFLVATAAAVLLGAHGRWRQVSQRQDEVPFEDEDSRQYYRTALNLRDCGVLSPDPAGPCPTRQPAALRGPLYPVFLRAALGRSSTPRRAWRANAAASAAVLALTAAAAWGLFPPAAGAAVAAAIAWDPRQHAVLLTLDVQAFYGLLVLLAGLALLAWASRPTALAAAAAGLLVGVSLCARSTLILFPLFCVALFWPLRRIIPSAGGQGAVFLLACLLPVLPWAWRNFSVLGRFQPLEMQTTSFVIASGAQAHASNDFPMEATEEPGARDKIYAGLGDDSLAATGAVLRQAAARVLREPWPYFQACLVRLLNLWGPWLLAWPVIVWGLGRLRARPEAWALAAVPLYWNIHAFILSSHRHAAAATPLLALACGLAWLPAGKIPGKTDAFLAGLRKFLPALALPGLALWAACVLLLIGETRLLPAETGRAALSLRQAQAAAEAGETSPARQTLDTLMLKPEAAPPYLRAEAARLYQKLGLPRRCAEILDELSALIADDAVLRLDAAVCSELSGESGAALRHAEQAVRLDPRLLSASLTLGVLLERRGRLKAALEEYERALRQAPQGLDARQRDLIARQRLRLRDALKRS